MKQSWEDYYEGKMAIGSIALIVIGIIAAIIWIPDMIKGFIASIQEKWLSFLPIVVLIGAWALALIVWSKSKKNANRRLGIVFAACAIPEVALACVCFDLANALAGGIAVAFAILMAVLGGLIILFPDKPPFQ